jgi:hypothetical protein
LLISARAQKRLDGNVKRHRAIARGNKKRPNRQIQHHRKNNAVGFARAAGKVLDVARIGIGNRQHAQERQACACYQKANHGGENFRACFLPHGGRVNQVARAEK